MAGPERPDYINYSISIPAWDAGDPNNGLSWHGIDGIPAGSPVWRAGEARAAWDQGHR